MANPVPPYSFISGSINNSRTAVISLLVTGGGPPTATTPEITNNGGAIDLPALSINGQVTTAFAVNALDSPGLVALVAAGALTGQQSGGTLPLITLNLAAGFIVTLPAAAGLPGGSGFCFVSALAPTSGNGYEVDPVGADVMRGNGFTPAAAKGARNTQATARLGDSLTVISDGVSAWYITGLTGTWARTP